MFFKIKGKIIKVYKESKKIKIFLYNTEDVEHFNHLLSLIDQDQNENNTYTFKLMPNIKIDVKSIVNYNNMDDLLHLNVIISGSTKYYCFDLNKNKSDDLNNQPNIVQGYTFMVKKLSNYNDNN